MPTIQLNTHQTLLGNNDRIFPINKLNVEKKPMTQQVSKRPTRKSTQGHISID